MALFILTLLDVATTTELLMIGGTEANPFAVFQMKTFGFENAVRIKIGAVLLLGGLIVLNDKACRSEEDRVVSDRMFTLLLLGLVVFFIVVVASTSYWVIYARSLQHPGKAFMCSQ